VRIGDEAAESAFGVTNLTDPSALSTDSNLRIASVTKTVTSAVMLQLVDEGLVDLDEPVSAYLPEWSAAAQDAGAADVTVRQLLQHTSGFSDYAVDPVFYLKVLSRLDVAIEPEEIVEFSLDQGLLFEPGTDYNYSTSNYVIAGLIIEAVTGNPAHVEFGTRVFEPLGLETLYLTPGEFPPDPVVNGYMDLRDEAADGDGAGLAQLLGAATAVLPEESVLEMADGTWIDFGALPQELLTSVSWTGGGLEGQVADVAMLIPGFFNSGMLSEQSLEELTTPSEHHNRSVGLEIDEVSGYTIYTHGGIVPGFRSGVAYVPELDLSMAVLANSMPLASDVYDLFDAVAKLVADSAD
jgi:D-alanyl-D-alanine carboxypeptidase